MQNPKPLNFCALSAILVFLAACGSPATPIADVPGTVQASVKLTLAAQPSATPSTTAPVSQALPNPPKSGATQCGPAVGGIQPPYNLWRSDNFGPTTSFSSSDHIVMTNYYYWYDVASGAHTAATGQGALRYHPPNMQDFSYLSESWHARELKDMIAAKIDIMLPVYWGIPCQNDAPETQWSDTGLAHLVRAMDSIIAAGQQPPKIGMGHDTHALGLSSTYYNHPGGKIDLTNAQGKARFYQPISNFFHIVPPQHWAQIDNRPVIFVGSPDYAAAYDPSLFSYVRENFQREFGRLPYLIAEDLWLKNANMAGVLGSLVDSEYSGNGARDPNWHSNGTLGMAAFGPGYSNVANPTPSPDRRNGGYYEDAWKQTLEWGKTPKNNLAVVFTWNELHDGTNINDTQELGRQYIDLTAAYVCRFKTGADCIATPEKPNASSSQPPAAPVETVKLGVKRITLLPGRLTHIPFSVAAAGKYCVMLDGTVIAINGFIMLRNGREGVQKDYVIATPGAAYARLCYTLTPGNYDLGLDGGGTYDVSVLNK